MHAPRPSALGCIADAPPPAAGAFIEGPRRRDNSTIPRILHQTFKSCELRADEASLRETCTRVHNQEEGWRALLWTDTANRELVRRDYAASLRVYNGYDDHMKRVDSARLFQLHAYGGVYLDMDFACLRSLNAVLQSSDFLVAQQHPSSCTHRFYCPKWSLVANAFMAAPRAHPFTEFLIQRLRASAKKRLLHATGPGFLTAAVQAWRARGYSGVRVLPFCTMYGARWYLQHPCNRSSLDACARQLPATLTTSFWLGSWKKKAASEKLSRPDVSCLGAHA